MTNYSMQKGRRRNDRIKVIKRIVLFTVLFWGMFLLFQYWNQQDSKLMETNYCWDSSGNHYVAPDERCRN